jgi:hypothetical protein
MPIRTLILSLASSALLLSSCALPTVSPSSPSAEVIFEVAAVSKNDVLWQVLDAGTCKLTGQGRFKMERIEASRPVVIAAQMTSFGGVWKTAVCKVAIEFTPKDKQVYHARLLLGTLGAIGNGYGIDQCRLTLLSEDEAGRTSSVSTARPTQCE